MHWKGHLTKIAPVLQKVKSPAVHTWVHLNPRYLEGIWLPARIAETFAVNYMAYILLCYPYWCLNEKEFFEKVVSVSNVTSVNHRRRPKRTWKDIVEAHIKK